MLICKSLKSRVLCPLLYPHYCNSFFTDHYFRGIYISREHRQSSKIKILNVEEAWFSISIREFIFREQELNGLLAKYKRLENNQITKACHVPPKQWIANIPRDDA